MDKRQQSQEVRDGDRFRDTKYGERFRDGRSSRDGFQGSRREDWDSQARDGRDPRFARDQGYWDPKQGRQQFRGQEQWEAQNHKRMGDQSEERDVRQMTEEDLRHKIEDRRKGYNV